MKISKGNLWAMRAWMYTVPLGLGFAAAGGVLMLGATGVRRPPPMPTVTKHPVTPEMEKLSAKMLAAAAPSFEAKDHRGQTWNLEMLREKGPVFISFVKDGCPCSVDVEPLYHRLYQRFKGKIEFVGIIDKDRDVAAKWAAKNAVPYPLILDPKLEIVNAYKATNSAFAVLVTKSGTIDKMWPGYSQSILKDMNARMAALLGEKEQPFDALYAPKEPLSGCAFEMPE